MIIRSNESTLPRIFAYVSENPNSSIEDVSRGAKVCMSAVRRQLNSYHLGTKVNVFIRGKKTRQVVRSNGEIRGSFRYFYSVNESKAEICAPLTKNPCELMQHFYGMVA